MKEVAPRNDEPGNLVSGGVSRFWATAARLNYLGAGRPDFFSSLRMKSAETCSARRQSVLGDAKRAARCVIFAKQATLTPPSSCGLLVIGAFAVRGWSRTQMTRATSSGEMRQRQWARDFGW